jgi:hypothetical protein
MPKKGVLWLRTIVYFILPTKFFPVIKFAAIIFSSTKGLSVLPLRYLSIIKVAIGAAQSPPNPAFSTIHAIAILG